MTGPRRAPSVLFFNRVYPPAAGATGHLLADLAGGLVNRGWRVTVVTSGSEPSGERDGVWVERVGGGELDRTSMLRRAGAYIGLYPRLLGHALRLPAHDLIVTQTDPPLLLILGPIVGRLRGGRSVHWVQDLYPEVVEAMGVLRPRGVIASLSRFVSTWGLRRQRRVVAIGRCMRTRLLERGVPDERITLVPNWPPPQIHPVAQDANGFLSEHRLAGRFVVTYSGNMGMAHPFDAVLDAAAVLAARSPHVIFLLIGHGPRRAWLETEIGRRQLTNILLLPSQPPERLAESLSAADVSLVTMGERLTGLLVPSKAYGALAAGRPLIFLGPAESEIARLVLEHECGDVIQPNDGDALAAAIERWSTQTTARAAAGARAQQAVETSRSDAIASFDRLLRALA